MSMLSNHQRLAHVSRISQLESIVVPPRSTPTSTTPIRDEPKTSSRRKRAATSQSPLQTPKPVNTPPGDDGFWSPPTSPVQELQEPQYTRVATDIRISLLGPDPTLEADSEEFKKQAKEIKKDLQRLTRYTRRQHSNPATMAEYSRIQRPSSTPALTAIARVPTIMTQQQQQHQQQEQQLQQIPPQQKLEELQHEHEFRRRFSVQEGRDFLADFLRVHFAEHRDHVAIRTAKTLEEIKMIGNEEDVASGVRQCRRLFNAPVLSDSVGSLLYEELRQGEDLDHSHEWRPSITDDDDERVYEEDKKNDGLQQSRENRKKDKKKKKKIPAPEELRQWRVDDFERSKAEFIEMMQLAATAQNVNGNNSSNTALCRCASLAGPTSTSGCMACSRPPPGGQSSEPNIISFKPRRDGAAQSYAARSEEELDELARELLAGRKSVDSILSEVKRRTFRGAELIAASLAAGYQ
ncbi:hypothetical protein PG994_002603 [Apiospora phragmitis]|uniref:Uncharacterized protein n=1 Tax=Apiospora phragmitis TaxID=2905665 RepID=A0ABR1W5K1_9PEZI